MKGLCRWLRFDQHIVGDWFCRESDGQQRAEGRVARTAAVEAKDELVEVDETEIPLRSKDDPLTGGGGRSAQGKMLVAGAVEIGHGAPGRIRLAAIRNFSAASLHGFIGTHVEKGATIKTDGWAAYPGVPDVAAASVFQS